MRNPVCVCVGGECGRAETACWLLIPNRMLDCVGPCLTDVHDCPSGTEGWEQRHSYLCPHTTHMPPCHVWHAGRPRSTTARTGSPPPTTTGGPSRCSSLRLPSLLWPLSRPPSQARPHARSRRLQHLATSTRAWPSKDDTRAQHCTAPAGCSRAAGSLGSTMCRPGTSPCVHATTLGAYTAHTGRKCLSGEAVCRPTWEALLPWA